MSDEILDVIFHQLLATSKASKAANQLAKNLLKETAEAMQNHTGKFFDGMLGTWPLLDLKTRHLLVVCLSE